jgi:hypothetical protein
MKTTLRGWITPTGQYLEVLKNHIDDLKIKFPKLDAENAVDFGYVHIGVDDHELYLELIPDMHNKVIKFFKKNNTMLKNIKFINFQYFSNMKYIKTKSMSIDEL